MRYHLSRCLCPLLPFVLIACGDTGADMADLQDMQNLAGTTASGSSSANNGFGGGSTATTTASNGSQQGIQNPTSGGATNGGLSNSSNGVGQQENTTSNTASGGGATNPTMTADTSGGGQMNAAGGASGQMPSNNMTGFPVGGGMNQQMGTGGSGGTSGEQMNTGGTPGAEGGTGNTGQETGGVGGMMQEMNNQPMTGAELYAANCGACHGDEAVGSAAAPQIRYSDEGLAEYLTRNGRVTMTYPKDMPAVGPDVLSDEELALITEYLWSFPKPTTGEELFIQMCANCHGEDGRGGPTGRAVAGEGANVQRLVRNGHAGAYDDRREFMPTYDQSKISDAELTMITDFINTLSRF